MHFSYGILWNEVVAGTLVTVPCTQAGKQLRSGLFASHQCYHTAKWGLVDLTNCLLSEDGGNSVTIWVKLNVDSIDQIQSNQTSLEQYVSWKYPKKNNTYY